MIAELLSVVVEAVPILRDKFGRLAVEVERVSFCDLNADRDRSELVFVVEHPTRFQAELRISNGNLPRTGIKNMLLSVGKQTFPWNKESVEPLSPGDIRNIVVSFPTQGAVTDAGKFELEITDTRDQVIKKTGSLAEGRP